MMFSLQLILQFTEGVQWIYYRGGPTFSRWGGGPTFFRGGGGGGGVLMLISIETHITFQGGLSPLWTRTWHDNKIGTDQQTAWS